MQKYVRCCLLVASLSFSVFVGCKNDKEEDVQPTTPTPTPQPQICDTNAITYSNSVAAILSANCTSCHGTNGSGGVSLNSHAGVRAQAINGKLMGVINHAPGFSPMPQGGAKLSDCNIAKIKKWVDDGAPNN